MLKAQVSFPSRATHAVAERGVAAGLTQQQLDDLHVAVLAGAHQRRGALVVLDVDVGPVSQQGPNHVHPAVADRQHQPRLTRLKQGQQHVEGDRFHSLTPASSSSSLL